MLFITGCIIAGLLFGLAFSRSKGKEIDKDIEKIQAITEDLRQFRQKNHDEILIEEEKPVKVRRRQIYF